ncbi:hypothetical protein DFH28DRAFT_933777 [Melampsora americana]|nr:hypothetical protein DFH28DRAFT_933777 [Melampsora americana]
MDSTTPSSPPQQGHTIPQNTPTSTPTNLVQPSLAAIQPADSQANQLATPFPVPTLSPEAWFRLHQINPVTSLVSLQANQPQPAPAPPQEVEAPMAPPESTKKRGRPRKDSAAPPSQKKGLKKSKSISSSQPASASQIEIESIIKSPDDTQETDKMDMDPNKSKKCWFTPDSDGKSDMDLVAKWCSVFENYNAWRTQKQATGKGNDSDALFHFTVSKAEIDEFKLAMRRGKRADTGAGTLQVRILRECPWYEELEPAFRHRPSARPLATRDSLGNQVHQTKPLTQSTQDNIPSPTKSTNPNDVWEATPPRKERECLIDPGLWDENTSPQERGTPGIPATKKSA